MQYYLRHYFDPDFDYLHRKPVNLEADGDTDIYSLGYVQNVIAGQLLAEIVSLRDAGPNPNLKYILSSPTLPVGDNTHIDPAYPNYLISNINGYVFYYRGRITVKGLLNVRQDISFHTGNIFFVGDMAVHGSVRSGFSVQANNVRIMGMVEGGVVRARRDLMVEGGARGGAGKHCLLDIGGKLLTPYVEKVEVRAKSNIVIDKYCLYSTVYAGANLVIKEQMYGSTAHIFGSAYIGKQLGNRAGIPTKVFMGYDPLKLRQMERLEVAISELSQSITHLKAVAGHLPPDTNETTKKLARQLEQREWLIERRSAILKILTHNEEHIHSCYLKVPGKIYPGVEICIGQAFYTVEDQCENMMFRLVEDEILVEPIPIAEQKLKQAQ